MLMKMLYELENGQQNNDETTRRDFCETCISSW